MLLVLSHLRGCPQAFEDGRMADIVDEREEEADYEEICREQELQVQRGLQRAGSCRRHGQ